MIGPERKHRIEEQPPLLEVDPDWRKHWWNMPAFEQKNAAPAQRITVNFLCYEDAREFAKRLGLRGITSSTDSAWYPAESGIDAPNAWEYTDES
jgi:hypothetical protein